MGRFLNRGNLDFESIRHSEYVDKSSMIQVINKDLDTPFFFKVVSRPRRFGKSMAAKMLYAYYDKSCDSRHLFEDLAIAKMPSFEEHLNKYPTIFVDMTEFTSQYRKNPYIVKIIQQTIKEEICEIYPDVNIKESYGLMDTLFAVADQTKERFVMIIDEWDAICREFDDMPEVMDEFVNLLRRMFKGSCTVQVFVGAYLTGIMPVKRYNNESGLNNYRTESVVRSGQLSDSFGFTRDEVAALCKKYDMDMSEMEDWYDGYTIKKSNHIYNPYSVKEAIFRKRCDAYWLRTASCDIITDYIQMNYAGLKEDAIRLLAGESVYVKTGGFLNDLKIVRSKNDVLTALIHLGYLTYDVESETCRIPNKEVAVDFQNAVAYTSWSEVTDVINNSRNLFGATIECDERAVAHAFDVAFQENMSILGYDNEKSMARMLTIAYGWAKFFYSIDREYATGKGYADLVMIPRRNCDKPAIIVELKYNTAVNTAIDQIKRRDYPEKVRDYTGNMLLVGVSYDREDKVHECRIEKVS